MKGYAVASPRTKKGTSQESSAWMRRLVLRFAFAGAVTGAGAVAHHHYGTKEDVHATVLSVKPVDYFDRNAGMIIKTDRGTFSNTPSRFFHGKGDDDVFFFNTHLQPGAEVVMTVYGREKDGPRNISGLRVVDRARDNTWFGYAAPAADTAFIRATQPMLYRDMVALSRLPLTGKPIFDVITDPAHGITAETQPADNDNTAGSYSLRTRRLSLEMGTDAQTTFHEYFHAVQDINDGEHGFYELGLKDAVFCGLLQEACAMAYEFACLREAENRGIYLRGEKTGSEVERELDDIFDNAYQSGWASCKNRNAVVREKEALAAGGQAIVRYLMGGALQGWTYHYRMQVGMNVNVNAHRIATSPHYLESDAYAEKRLYIFSQMGHISEGFNIVPAEYLGPTSARYVDIALKVSKVTLPEPVSSPYRPAPYKN